MKIKNKYHKREEYEKLLDRLSKTANIKTINTSTSSNVELLININNLLAYLSVETYTLEEIEKIVDFLNE